MGLYKRNGIYWMRFSVNGKDVRRSTKTDKLSRARAVEAKVRTAIHEGKYFDSVPGENIRVSTVFDRYLSEATPRKSPGSQSRDVTIINNCTPHLGHLMISKVTPKDITAYRDARRNAGVSDATVNKELGLLKTIWNKAFTEWELISTNPLLKIKLEKVSNNRVKTLSPHQYMQLISACPPWLKPIVITARWTGLRRGNVVGLLVSHVDLARKMLHVPMTKNGAPVSVPIWPSIFPMLVNLVKEAQDQGREHLFMFNGRPAPGNEVYRGFDRVCRKVGLKDFRFHDLRHAFASWLIQNKVPLSHIQAWLGHKDSRMTNRYAHLSPDDLLNEVDRLTNEGGQDESIERMAR